MTAAPDRERLVRDETNKEPHMQAEVPEVPSLDWSRPVYNRPALERGGLRQPNGDDEAVLIEGAAL